MKTSPIKAVIRLMLNTRRQYAIDITFVITLTCFHNSWNHRFHNVQAWQPWKMERNINTHITVNYTNTHENWADSFYHSGNAGKSHNPCIWHLFSALSVSLCCWQFFRSCSNEVFQTVHDDNLDFSEGYSGPCKMELNAVFPWHISIERSARFVVLLHIRTQLWS